MKLVTKRQLQAAKFCSNDETREVLNSLLIEPHQTTATDGHRLIQVFIPKECRPEPEGYPEELKQRKKNLLLKKKHAETMFKGIPAKNKLTCAAYGQNDDPKKVDFVIIDEKDNAQELKTFPVSTGVFPDVDQVIQKNTAGKKIRIGVDAKYLKEVAEFVEKGQKGPNKILVLEIDKNDPENTALVFRAKDDDKTEIFGLIMPMRI